jgi:hypothetical protein
VDIEAKTRIRMGIQPQVYSYPRVVFTHGFLTDVTCEYLQVSDNREGLCRGLHPAFHASLLRVHVPNDDRLFPGRLASQLGFADQLEPEWSIRQIVAHEGTGYDTVF